MTGLSACRRLALAAWGLPLLWAGCGGETPVAVRAPAVIESALSLVSDLEAAVTLVPQGGDPLAPTALDRGDDGVSFSGFVPVAPGQYTLELVFTGIPAQAVHGGERRFLGRLVSASFTVTQGSVAQPKFTSPLDTIGRAGDGGDEDGDQLGFLHELLLGTDPKGPDSDTDAVIDGVDCRPMDALGRFAIVEGGSVNDCDADGFRSVRALTGEPGNDCNDEDDAVHPGAEDLCSDAVDQDCSAQTCPADDGDGPLITVAAPKQQGALGCQGTLEVQANDPSGVTEVTATLDEFPYINNFPRSIFLTATDDGRFVAAEGFGGTGGGLKSGPTTLTVRAVDSRGNTSALVLPIELVLALPEVTVTGPQVLGDEPPAALTFAPSGARPLTSLEVRAAPLNEQNQLVMGQERVLARLDPTSGGSVRIDPADHEGKVVIYPVAVDDVGNRLAPNATAFFAQAQGSFSASFFCDGHQHVVPAVARLPGVEPAAMGDHLEEALAVAQAFDADAFLVSIMGNGVQNDGVVDLSMPDTQLRQWSYSFSTPARVAGKDEGFRVTWFSAGMLFNRENPVLEDDIVSSVFADALPGPLGLPDSPAVADAVPCGRLLAGDPDDFMMWSVRDGRGEVQVNGEDFVWRGDATTLTPDFSSCP